MEVTIERILPGGLGLAHAGGKTVMVALAAPGDRLRVRIDREKGTVCFASIVEIIEPSPHRIDPPCPYFGRCGGCDFQQMTYEAQLNAKVEIIKDCLHRIAKIENPPDFQITSAPHEWHYRSRAQWQYNAEHKRLGYYESGSRRVCDVAECAVLAPELQRALAHLRQQMAENLLPSNAKYLRAVVGDDGVAMSSGPSGPRSRENRAHEIRRTINHESYALSAESFFQTNEDLVPELIEAAIGNASGDTAIELYSGVGLFTLPLARRFKRVIAIEDNSEATEFAYRNLASAGLLNATVVNRKAADWLQNVTGDNESIRRLERKRPACVERTNRAPAAASETLAIPSANAHVDFLLLDPPRTGAESRVIDGILQLAPKRICYVSCDPATLARDLRKIIAGGYSLDSLAAFDMFPQTHHVETVAKLSGP